MSQPEISGVILAGGRASRWDGRDKGLIEVAGRPMTAHVLEAFAPQVDSVLLSANRNLEQYRAFGVPVLTDQSEEFLGPLAGIASALEEASTSWLAVVPCDAPLLPADCVARLRAGLDGERFDIAAAHDGERIQPLFAVIRRSLLENLRAFLDSGGRSTQDWYRQQRMQLVDFSDRPQSFSNINRPEDRERLEAQMRGQGAHD